MKIKINDIVKFKKLYTSDTTHESIITEHMLVLSQQYGRVMSEDCNRFFAISDKRLHSAILFTPTMVDQVVGEWKTQYEVGDKVSICPDIEINDIYSGITVRDTMLKNINKSYIVEESKEYGVTLDNGFYYSLEMIMGAITKTEVKQVIPIGLRTMEYIYKERKSDEKNYSKTTKLS